jgi:hypothetical protein
LPLIRRFAAAILVAASFIAFATSSSALADAQTLYTATTRAYFSPSEIVGRLYIVDPATAEARLVGPLRLRDGGAYIGVTGLAVDPRTRVLYGVTAGLSPGLPPSLIKIDPKTAQATLVGRLGHSAADINFDAAGRLFAWLTDIKQMGIVDLANGVATPLGPASSIPEATGGGLAMDARGIAHIAATTAAGTIDTFDTRTKVLTQGPVLTGAPYLSAIHSLTFSAAGVLYGVNSNLSVPAKTALVVIDPVSGLVSLVGALPEDAIGLAFSPDAVAEAEQSNLVRPAYLAVAGAALLGGVVVFALRQLRNVSR